MIQLDQITKTYYLQKPLTVLNEVSLTIHPQEFVGILGASGSGKSTLLHIMGLLDKPTSGSICFQGRDTARLDDDALSTLRGRSIGFVFQSFRLIGHLSIEENVELPLFYQRVPKEERRARAQRAMHEVHIDHRAHHQPSQLSGGECQRAAIARALVSNPPLILADEPTGNLDSQTGEEIFQTFRQLHEEGRTICIITHDPKLAERIPRIIRLADGSVVGGGS